MPAPRTRRHGPLVALAVGWAALACAAPGAGTGGTASPVPRMRPLLARVILTVNDYYDDPARIDPPGMIRAAMRAVSASFPSVVVEEEPSAGALTIAVGGDTQRVVLGEVRTIWRTATVLDGLLTFVEGRLPPPPRPGMVTEVAIDGFLRALDPRSGLFDARTHRPVVDAPGEEVSEEAARAAAAGRSVAESRVLAPGVAYVRLVRLWVNARGELSEAIAARRAEAGGAFRGVVLDLRDNTGGLFDEAVKVADLFLASGPIVTLASTGKRSPPPVEHPAKVEPDDLLSVPVVVLVDGLSASGTEIVAAALRDGGRALLVGTRTAGYGKVQSIYGFDDDGKHGAERVDLKLSVAHVVTPAGALLDGAGLVPDVDAGPSPDDAALRLASEVLAREPSPDRARLLEAARALRAPR